VWSHLIKMQITSQHVAAIQDSRHKRCIRCYSPFIPSHNRRFTRRFSTINVHLKDLYIFYGAPSAAERTAFIFTEMIQSALRAKWNRNVIQQLPTENAQDGPHIIAWRRHFFYVKFHTFLNRNSEILLLVTKTSLLTIQKCSNHQSPSTVWLTGQVTALSLTICFLDLLAPELFFFYFSTPCI